jgi:ABC-2 type transport system permease protein
LLSGAFFPADSGWLRWIMIVNPLTYGIAGLRRFLYLGETTPAVLAGMNGLPSLPVSLGVTALFAAVTFGLACWIAGQRTTGDLL